MQPVDDEPFWIGRLKKYNLNSDGSVGTVAWDAGDKLATKSASSRTIKTYISGNMVDFNTSNITPQLLGLSSGATAQRDLVVGYFRGEDAYNEDNWKLGDIWHSNPVVITSPSAYFEDKVDNNNAFATFRSNNQRTSSAGTKIATAGANDGQFHFFETGQGQEIMSFIPPNLLHRLPLVAHSTHPTGLTHQYFVDGPTSAADVWLGTGSGTSKSASDWKTILVFGLGRGGEVGAPNLWSANSSCTPDTSIANNGYSQTYSVSTPYYCGYYAFDVTTTTNPTFKWRLNPTSSQAYFGAPWSKMAIGRVKINGNEKWVGFIGGGGFSYSCGGGQPSPPNSNWGKGFFVVDLNDGSILWSYTKANNSDMDYSIPAPPGIVDYDNDGFIDTAYVGDLGGNMWRFKFCLGSQSSCSTSSWSGGLMYRQQTGQIRPIYTGSSITKDPSGNLWVYWGSGDKQCPNDSNAQERFYAIKDNRTSTFTFSDLENITSSSQTYDGSKQGYSILMTGQGEKILSDPVVFGGVVYFTTFTPASGSDPCAQGGTSRLYGVNYLSGSGALTGGARTTTLSGTGIASSPIVSINPNSGQPDLYLTISGGGGVDSPGVTRPTAASLSLPSNKSKMLFWRDRRVQ
jgi:Tfp pilus tip-associated adhesin PilY1